METQEVEELKNKAMEFLTKSEVFARKVGQLAQENNINTDIFMFSLLACVSAAESMNPEAFKAVKKFYDAVNENTKQKFN